MFSQIHAAIKTANKPVHPNNFVTVEMWVGTHDEFMPVNFTILKLYNNFAKVLIWKNTDNGLKPSHVEIVKRDMLESYELTSYIIPVSA